MLNRTRVALTLLVNRIRAAIAVGLFAGAVYGQPQLETPQLESRQSLQVDADDAQARGANAPFLVEILEGKLSLDWAKRDEAKLRKTESYEHDWLALATLPQKYNPQALRADRSSPFLVRLSGELWLDEGVHSLLLRSMNAARLKVDGREVTATRIIPPNADGHEEVPDIPQAQVDGMRRLPVGHAEVAFTFESAGAVHTVEIEIFVGGKKLRPELGEFSLSRLGTDGRYHVLGRSQQQDVTTFPLEDSDWEQFSRDEHQAMRTVNRRARMSIGADEQRYWNWRHATIREWQADQLAERSGASAVVGDFFQAVDAVDSIVRTQRSKAGFAELEPAAELAFLRRATLDTTGRLPTRAEIDSYLNLPAEERRTATVERLLSDPGWADHWVGYWQDVLAENPGILKPQLNNTGPFRYWIHESFADNKPIDQFVTELIMMEGSKYYGGPAGFAMASQNDVPMGAKAQIIAQAFMGMEMKCARCHDAPFQAVDQRDLFGLAAMLSRKPQQVPASSSIPLPAEELANLAVSVTLEPGTMVEPHWPFADRDGVERAYPEGWLRRENDSRELFAARVTDFRNPRFARVIANRLWQRYTGEPLVDPLEHWEDVPTGSPAALLDRLASELTYSGYDLKHLARVILSSRLYGSSVASTRTQLETNEESEAPSSASSPEPLPSGFRLAARRMSAEQVIDSLFLISGKRIECEPLTLDVDGRRPPSSFLNLGTPQRAWEFTSLSNERDRPALAMPQAQSVVDVLEMFGWRASRQNPITVRSTEATVQQPAIMANGLVARRVSTLTDGSLLTKFCFEADDTRGLTRDLVLQILTREPTEREYRLVEEMLRDGFHTRQTTANAEHVARPKPHAVSWSNHLNAEATRIKLEMERWVREGDSPSARLESDWRERAEDVVWALINTPEFVFVP